MAGLVAPVIERELPLPEAPPLHIREPLAEEAHQARELQQHAFSHPDSSGPAPTGLGQSRELRVVSVDGRVVSCLTLLHAELSFRGASLSMAGICQVATDPEERNKGFAGELIRNSLREMRRRGIATTVLFPFSFRYYRKFGYELGGNHCHFWCRPNCIPAYSEHRLSRSATCSDASLLADFSTRRCSALACALPRTRERWDALCRDPQVSVTVCGDDDLQGYLITTESRDAYGGRVLKVLDLTAVSPFGWRCLLGKLSRAQVESIEWSASHTDLEASGLLRSTAPLREGFKPRAIVTVRPMFQFRVVDVERALRGRLRSFPAGEHRLTFRVEDELLPENREPVALHPGNDGWEIRSARPTDPYLRMDIRTFSQVFCGYMSPVEAVSQGLATASSPTALETAETLFAPGEPYLSELDRF